MKNNKVFLIIVIVFGLLVLAAFTFNILVKPTRVEVSGLKKDYNNIQNTQPETKTSTGGASLQEETVPLTQDNSLNSIEADLNNTTIVEEDLTDLQ